MVTTLIRGSLSARAGSDSFQLAGSETCHYCHWWQEIPVPTILLRPFISWQRWKHLLTQKAAKVDSLHAEQDPGARTGRVSAATQGGRRGARSSEPSLSSTCPSARCELNHQVPPPSSSQSTASHLGQDPSSCFTPWSRCLWVPWPYRRSGSSGCSACRDSRPEGTQHDPCLWPNAVHYL